MSHDIEQHTPAPLPTRRTVLTGAAWSVPVIAAASLAPFAAASGTPELAFNQASYSGTACGTITGASVSVTTNGTATAGVSVTTTLSGGYTFSGGSTSYTQLSGGTGQVVLPAIVVPASGGTRTMTASDGSSSSTAALMGTSNGTAKVWYSSASGVSDHSNIPAGSVPVGWVTYLAPNGDLYYNNGSTPLATNVTSAVAEHSEPGSGFQRNFITFVSNGSAKVWYSGAPGIISHGNVPIGSTAVGWQTFLAPNGDLYYNNGSTPLATNVTSAVAQHQEPGSGFQRDFIAFVSNGSAKVWYSGASGISTFGNVPVNSTAVGWLTFLAPNGDLYYNNGSTPLATNVSSAVAQHQEPGSGFQRDFIAFVSNGSAKVWYSGASGISTFGNVPVNSTAVGWLTFLAPNGSLYYNNGVNPLASNIANAIAEHEEPGSGFQRDFVTFTAFTQC